MDAENIIFKELADCLPEHDNKHRFKYPNISSTKITDICDRLEISEQTIIYAYINVINCVYSAVTINGIVLGRDLTSFFGISFGAKRIFLDWKEIERIEYDADNKNFYIHLSDSSYYKRGRFDMLGYSISATQGILIAEKLTNCAKAFDNYEEILEDFNKAEESGQIDVAESIANNILNGTQTLSSSKEYGYLLMTRVILMKRDDIESRINERKNKISSSSDSVIMTLETEKEAIRKDYLLYCDLAIKNSTDNDLKSYLLLNRARASSNSVDTRRYAIAAMCNEENFIEALNVYREETKKQLEIIKNQGFVSFIKQDNISPFIFIVQDDLHLKGCFDASGEICNVYTLDKLPKGIIFQNGRPTSNTLYIPHPCDSSLYVAYEGSSRALFLSKVHEYCYLVQCLGATSVTLKSINGLKFDSKIEESINLNGQVDVKTTSVNANYSSNTINNEGKNSSNNTDISQTFAPIKKPYIPEGLIWYSHEIEWQQLAQQRINGNLLHYELCISSNDSTNISRNQETRIAAGYKNLIVGVNLNYGTNINENFSSDVNSEWKIIVDFKSVDEF